MAASRRLGVGFIGSGFNARFHMLSWPGVRDADVLGVWSPNPRNAASAAAYARSLDIGACRPYKTIREMVADPAIDAIWLTGPNQARIENVEEIVHAVEKGKGTLKGIACEKPLARNVADRAEQTAHVLGERVDHYLGRDEEAAWRKVRELREGVARYTQARIS